VAWNCPHLHIGWKAFPTKSLFLCLVLCAGAIAAAHEGFDRYNEPFRPQFHFSPEKNWMNDPNGLVFFDGEYHLFYQYNPEGNGWGHMSWGHAVSTDLVRWQHLPVALREENGVMIFSGSAVVDHHNTSGFGKDGKPPMVAIYTGHGLGRQTQDIAYSNDRGRTWTKYEKNPVIDIGSPEFRDPKVSWHEPTKQWVMVVAKPDQRKVLFWGSPDLKNWQQVGEFGPQGETGGIWECPDLFDLPVYRGTQKTDETRSVLVGNISGGTPAGGSGCQYFVGRFDGKTFANDNPKDTKLWADYGPDFYAAVSWSDIPKEDGRRIWLGWMTNWRYAGAEPTSPWRTAQSVPRELRLVETSKGLRLAQAPVRELQSLREGNGVQIDGKTISPGSDALGGAAVSGETLELLAIFENAGAEQFGLKVRVGRNEETVVGYDAARNEMFVDKTRAGRSNFHNEFAARHAAPRGSESKQIVMHVLVDRSSVELFGDGGLVSITERVFPDAASTGVSTFAKGGSAKLVSLRAWKLQSAWK
jgi:fructan beta-fructosidase